MRAGCQANKCYDVAKHEPKTCSGHGNCDASSGACRCDVGYTGVDCGDAAHLFGGSNGQIISYNTHIDSWHQSGCAHPCAVDNIRVENDCIYGVADGSLFVEVGWEDAAIVDRVSFKPAGGFENGYRLSFDGTVYANWQHVSDGINVVSIALPTPVKTMKLEGKGSNWCKLEHMFVDGRPSGNSPAPPPAPPSCSEAWTAGTIPKLQGAGSAAANALYSETGTQNGHAHYTNDNQPAYQIYYGGNSAWNLYGPGDRDYYRGATSTTRPTSAWQDSGCVGGCVGSSPAPSMVWCKPGPS